MKKYLITFGLSAILILVFISGCLNETSVDEEKSNEVVNHKPIADFTFTYNFYTVSFFDSSKDEDNDNLTFLWEFGDGNKSTERNPVHTYDSEGLQYFNVRLIVDDGERKDICQQQVEFYGDLDVIDFFCNPIREEDFKWILDVETTIENNGNIPAYIAYAETESGKDFYGIIYFNFTYTYYETVNDTGGQQVGIEYISNNTLKLNPNKSITLTSNPELSYLSYIRDDPFTPGNYPVTFWILEGYNPYEITLFLS